jgi:hypothetical protein
MVESGVEKKVKIIKNYEDLKNSKPGEFILIKGRSEIVITTSPHLSRFDFNDSKIYTVSVEGNYVIQNHYDNYNGNDEIHLEPFMKTSCRIDSDTALENNLSGIARVGGLL